MPTIAEIAQAIEEFAPLAFQESYDNSGLQIGDPAAKVEKALLCIDVTEAIVDEAIEGGFKLIISHHPLLFKGLKTIQGRTLQERIAIKCIKYDIAVYAGHTNVDTAYRGVSYTMAQQLELTDVRPLQPLSGHLSKLVVFVPVSHRQAVSEAVWAAGGGQQGDYDRCSYAMNGEGSFRALDGASPYVGEPGNDHIEQEARLEFLVPRHAMGKAVAAMLKAHPYEEPAFDIIELQNASRREGLGLIGNLPHPLPLVDFIKLLKERFGTGAVRYSAGTGGNIGRIALCGGAGVSFLRNAIAQKADAYVSGDFRYHDFTDYGNSIAIADIGHYESEQYTKAVFYEILSKKFPNFVAQNAKKETNPIKYL